jgi:hypothetical protein
MSQRIVSTFLSRQDPKEQIGKILDICNAGLHHLGKAQAWSSTFSSVLKAAEQEDRTSLEPGEVWIGLFHAWYNEWQAIEKLLENLVGDLQDASRPALPRKPVRQGLDAFTLCENLEDNLNPYTLAHNLGFINDALVSPFHGTNPNRKGDFAASIELLHKWHAKFDKGLAEAIRAVTDDMKHLAKFAKIL